MLLRRVIPCLDVAAGRVAKGARFVDLRDAGDPAELAARYAAAGADEIVLLDITAAPEGRATRLGLVGRTARRRAVPRAGADKVAVNTAAIADPGLIRRCARVFGRQCVVVAVDVRAVSADGGWGVLGRGGRDATGLDAVAWVRRAAGLGAGEILLTSIDRDGTRSGFDLDLLRGVA